jgi:hypothetical protein
VHLNRGQYDCILPPPSCCEAASKSVAKSREKSVNFSLPNMTA